MPEYGESPNGRVAHIYRDDEDVSLCGVELVRGVTDKTAWTLCGKCEALAPVRSSPHPEAPE